MQPVRQRQASHTGKIAARCRTSGTGAPYVVVGRFALALYPMLEAQVGAEVGLSPAQWRQLGAAARQVHAVPVTPQLARLVGRAT